MDNPIASHFARAVKGWQEDHGMTLKVLADNSGLSVSYISDIERERTVPSIQTIIRICDVFGMIPYLRFSEGILSTLDDTIAEADAELDYAMGALEALKIEIADRRNRVVGLRKQRLKQIAPTQESSE